MSQHSPYRDPVDALLLGAKIVERSLFDCKPAASVVRKHVDGVGIARRPIAIASNSRWMISNASSARLHRSAANCSRRADKVAGHNLLFLNSIKRSRFFYFEISLSGAVNTSLSSGVRDPGYKIHSIKGQRLIFFSISYFSVFLFGL